MVSPSYLIFHKNFPLSVTGIRSGAEMATCNLARFLARLGEKVIVCARLDGPEVTHQNVQYWDTGVHYDVSDCLARARGIGPYHLLCASRADAILASSSEPNCLTRILISHDSRPGAAGVGYRELCGVADAIVAVSKAHQQLLIESGSVPDKTTVISNGVDHDIFFPPENPGERDPNLLVFAGALTYRKGLHTLVEAFESLVERRPHLRLDAIGSAKLWERQEYLDIAEIKQRNPGIHFHGPRAQTDIAARLRMASLSIVPSILFETFGLISVEAQACGCPVIAFDVGGIRETMIAGDTGALVEEISAPALARTIESFLSDPQELERLSENGPKFVKNRFDWSATARQIVELCNATVTKETGDSASLSRVDGRYRD